MGATFFSDQIIGIQFLRKLLFKNRILPPLGEFTVSDLAWKRTIFRPRENLRIVVCKSQAQSSLKQSKSGEVMKFFTVISIVYQIG